MRTHLILVHDQEQLECLAVPAEAVSAPAVVAAPEPERWMPGSGRRDWVYREMALLGPDAAAWVDSDG